MRLKIYKEAIIISYNKYKQNHKEVLIKTGDKFMPEMNLRQPEFTYNFVDLKAKKKLKNLKKQEFKIYLSKQIGRSLHSA